MDTDDELCFYGRRVTGSGATFGLCSWRMLSGMLCCTFHALLNDGVCLNPRRRRTEEMS